MKSKKILSIVGIILMAALVVFGLSLLVYKSQNKPDFTITAETSSQTVKAGESFTVTVITQVNRRYVYKSSSSYQAIGASPALYLEVDGEIYWLNGEPITISADTARVVLKKGQTITREWAFETLVNAEDMRNLPAPSGSYALKASFFGIEQVIENFITIE